MTRAWPLALVLVTTAWWKRMGTIVVQVGEDEVNERLTQVKKDHPDVPIDAKAFMSACSWPAGC